MLKREELSVKEGAPRSARKERALQQWEGPVQRSRHGKGAGAQEEISMAGAPRAVRTSG